MAVKFEIVKFVAKNNLILKNECELIFFCHSTHPKSPNIKCMSYTWQRDIYRVSSNFLGNVWRLKKIFTNILADYEMESNTLSKINSVSSIQLSSSENRYEINTNKFMAGLVDKNSQIFVNAIWIDMLTNIAHIDNGLD